MATETSNPYIHLFDTKPEHDAVYNGDAYKQPWLAYTIATEKVSYNKPDQSKKYLTFEALEDGTFTFVNSAFSCVLNYSLDNGKTWVGITENTATPTIEAGQRICFKAQLQPHTYNHLGLGNFSATGNFNASGNPLSLIYGDDFQDVVNIDGKENAFFNLFNGNTKLISAADLSLPATTIGISAYRQMFMDCTSLVSAPQISATTMGVYACYGMFSGCTSLTNAPRILPAATMTSSCYRIMFKGCTSLTTAPILPAETLTGQCYEEMFYGCSSLNYIKALFITAAFDTYGLCTKNWVSGVASTGTFVKNIAAEWNVTGVNGVPSSWTVETASE